MGDRRVCRLWITGAGVIEGLLQLGFECEEMSWMKFASGIWVLRPDSDIFLFDSKRDRTRQTDSSLGTFYLAKTATGDVSLISLPHLLTTFHPL
jgi:hypothetical protein